MRTSKCLAACFFLPISFFVIDFACSTIFPSPSPEILPKMHKKSYSEATSLEASTPPRSPRRPLYYVQSPSHPDVEKMSYASSPPASPVANHYHSSPIHHSRESSTSRFSASHKANRRDAAAHTLIGADVEDDDEEAEAERGPSGRFYVCCFLLSFFILFAVFSLILWAASKAYSPHVLVKRVVFEDFTVQAGMDHSGVPTDMLSLNSTVRMHYQNRGTFFGVHVTSTPLELYYFNLKVASGQMSEFYQRRMSSRNVTILVEGYQVPLYGGVSSLSNARESNNLQKERVRVGLNLTFTVRSRAYVLGRLVKSKFYKRIQCPVTLDGSGLGKPVKSTGSCLYH